MGEEAAGRTAKDRSKEQIEGFLQLKLSVDDDGEVWKRVVTTSLTTIAEDGEIEISTSREELLRTRVELD